VLDADAESRAVKRLFVADNAALANALGGPNPTLTTQALATRTAEKIFQRYFGGDPFVGREAPMSSIHPSVTKAVLGAHPGPSVTGATPPVPSSAGSPQPGSPPPPGASPQPSPGTGIPLVDSALHLLQRLLGSG
jgi:hypothetical protein